MVNLVIDCFVVFTMIFGPTLIYFKHGDGSLGAFFPKIFSRLSLFTGQAAKILGRNYWSVFLLGSMVRLAITAMFFRQNSTWIYRGEFYLKVNVLIFPSLFISYYGISVILRFR